MVTNFVSLEELFAPAVFVNTREGNRLLKYQRFMFARAPCIVTNHLVNLLIIISHTNHYYHVTS